MLARRRLDQRLPGLLLSGHSAGAHLAALVALRVADRLQAACPMPQCVPAWKRLSGGLTLLVPTHSIERACFRFHRMRPEFVWNASVPQGASSRREQTGVQSGASVRYKGLMVASMSSIQGRSKA